MLTLGLVGIALAIGLAVFMLLMSADEKAVVRASLRQLEGYEVENVRDQELLAPLKDRAVTPALRGVAGIGRRFTPAGYTENVRTKLVSAGKPDQADLDRFLAIRVITIVATVPAFLLILAFFPITGLPKLLFAGLVVLFLVLGPDAVLNRQVEARAYELRRRLPDVLDLLVISVEAGLGFEQALDRTVAAVPGPLSEEFARMLGEVRAGSSRADAMRALDARTNVPEVRSFVLAILQADTFGVSIGRVLRAQADEMRVRRRQIAQERAQKAPVKMLIPMVFCIFPALFVVVLGPAVINIYEAF
jgi:tight adherence protein C